MSGNKNSELRKAPHQTDGMFAQPTATPVEFRRAELSRLSTVRSMLLRELQSASTTYSSGAAAGCSCRGLPCSAELLAGYKAGSRYRDCPAPAAVPAQNIHEEAEEKAGMEGR